MFPWSLSFESETHTLVWIGEKTLIRPGRVKTEGAELNVTNAPTGEVKRLTLFGDKGYQRAQIEATSRENRVVVATLYPAVGEVFFPGGSRFHGRTDLDPKDRYFVNEVVEEHLRVNRDPDECHTYRVSLTRDLLHKLVPIPGVPIKLGDQLLKVASVVCDEDRYRVTIEGSLSELLGETKEELENDSWYRTVMELGGLPLKGWLVNVEEVECRNDHHLLPGSKFFYGLIA